MLLRPALPRRFEQLPATPEKGTHCDAIAGVAMGTLKALVLMYGSPGELFQLWLMGSDPGTRSGMPNVSEPLFCTPIGSPEMRGVVGIPLFSLRMPPISHPFTSAPKDPWRDLGPGTSQMPLIATLWVMLNSETARLICGANQNQVVMEFEKASPNIVAESSSIALL